MERKYVKVNADSLRRHDPKQQALHLELGRIGRDITAAIKNAHRGKRCSLKYDLPTGFIIPDMTPKDAQLYIYAKLVLELQTSDGDSAGYRVKFVGSVPCLLISWAVQLDEEKQVMQQTLQSASQVSLSVTQQSTPAELKSGPPYLTLPKQIL